MYYQGTEGGGGVGGGEGGGDSLQLLPPELLQMCIQQLAQQAITTSAEGGLAEDDSSITGGDSSDSSATLGLLQQVRHSVNQCRMLKCTPGSMPGKLCIHCMYIFPLIITAATSTPSAAHANPAASTGTTIRTGETLL